MTHRAMASLAGLTLMVSPAVAQATTPTPQCRIADVLGELAEDPTEVLPSGFTRGEIRTLATRMCGAMVLASSNGADFIVEDFDTYILDFNGWDRDTPNYQSRIAAFWNDHIELFICRSHGHRYMHDHLLIRAVEMGSHFEVALNGYILQDEELYPFDVNVVQIDETGKAETLLDHVDEILARGDQGYPLLYLREMREVIVTWYDARPAAELCPDAGN
ncbi:hypothetical protein [Maricaulis sp.]|uniref:hypothetical protein n=1 Tax=Maricaulis sp. TaxID=1486257 RepID=UPI0025EA98B5|nr:hypothetical protein [Maricaulis sp.]MDF1768436.1 hypothetical protein [Maricaulis sp.]